MENIIQLKKVTKKFGGITALNKASLNVKKGEVVGLIGDNGAGNSSLINSLRQTIGKVAQTNSRVLITGPSGAGKETCARSIHILSQRSDKAFIHLNCSMLNEEIIYGSDKSKNSSGSVIGILEKANR